MRLSLNDKIFNEIFFLGIRMIIFYNNDNFVILVLKDIDLEKPKMLIIFRDVKSQT